MHGSTCHTSKHSPIFLDLTSSLLHNKWAKYVHSATGKWRCLSQPTCREICHLVFSKSSSQSTTINTSEYEILHCRISPTIQYPELLICFNPICHGGRGGFHPPMPPLPVNFFLPHHFE